MHEFPSPADLYDLAGRLWPVGIEWDVRSASIRQVEAQIVAPGTIFVEVSAVRGENWIRSLHRHERYWRSHERSPREKTRNAATLPPEERRLGEWQRYQRRNAATLVPYQVIRLDVSPSFQWDPQQSAWIRNLTACQRHRRRTGELPYLNSADRDEYVLARWLGRQLAKAHTGTLTRSRAAMLQTLLDEGSGDAGRDFKK